MFFLLLSFRFCPPLKNDGSGVLLCHDILLLNEYIKEKNKERKPSPHTGKVSALADGRGKCEQTQKNGNKCEKKVKDDFYRTALNTCLSFLNGHKKQSGISL